MVLEDREIIQIDATVITGALIFLTLTSISPTDFERYIADDYTNFVNFFFVVVFASVIIVPFSFSAISSAVGHIKAARRIMIAGFLIIALEFLFFLGYWFYAWISFMQAG